MILLSPDQFQWEFWMRTAPWWIITGNGMEFQQAGLTLPAMLSFGHPPRWRPRWKNDGIFVFQWNSAWELQGKMQPLRWQPSQLLTASGTNCAKINPSLFANITSAPAALRSWAAWQSLLPLLFRLTFPQAWLLVFQVFTTNMISPPHQDSSLPNPFNDQPPHSLEIG